MCSNGSYNNHKYAHHRKGAGVYIALTTEPTEWENVVRGFQGSHSYATLVDIRDGKTNCGKMVFLQRDPVYSILEGEEG